ncbi:MAG: hypothetical protein AAFU56_12040 [Pseudomonadota bacterium]
MDTAGPGSDRRELEDDHREVATGDPALSSTSDEVAELDKGRSLVPVAVAQDRLPHKDAAYSGSLRGAATTSAPSVPGSHHRGQGTMVVLSVIVSLVTCIVVSAVAFIAINPPV